MSSASSNTGFCRDCLASVPKGAARCPTCHSPRVKHHPELHALAIAHIDCDAFYAAVEKRDNPALKDKPVIVGGAQRGVVSTACYIARIHGVKSAMPMFKALKLCPDAVVVKPNMAKYAEAGRAVRNLMLELTPLVQPVSIDEAFLDLTGTGRLHGASPALVLARLIQRIEKEVGVSASVGLSHNKFLAKLASDMEKPRGFSVIGRAETLALLAQKPVGAIWGIGKATQQLLERRGITTIAQVQQMDRNELIRQFGQMGARLHHLSRGEDSREVETSGEAKSISTETTFNEDIGDYETLEAKLWQLSQSVSRRAKKSATVGHTVTLKLKTPDFQTRTRALSLDEATNLAHVIFDAGKKLLRKEVGRQHFRLIGVGISHLVESATGPDGELDVRRLSLNKAEAAMDAIREKFGRSAVDRGISLKGKAGR
ncbi:MAG: DNA polymerase IV [Alphaproteobacteria bacterium]|nr:DNA polymerase IV [Alphaproteobacteria bacterium]